MGQTQAKSATVSILLLLVLFMLLLGLTLYFSLNPHIFQSFSTWLRALVDDAGPFGWLMIIGLMILHSFVPLPAELVALAAGMSYGLVLATIIVWIGAMLGAIVAFALARWLGEAFVTRLLGPTAHQKLEKWKLNQGVPTLLISRLIPVISFNLINYAAGLTGVPWWTFLWTTAIGIIPMTILSVLIGTGMGNLPFGWLIGLTILGIALVLLVHLWFRHRTNTHP